MSEQGWIERQIKQARTELDETPSWIKRATFFTGGPPVKTAAEVDNQKPTDNAGGECSQDD